jgi:hypothetical protein
MAETFPSSMDTSGRTKYPVLFTPLVSLLWGFSFHNPDHIIVLI